MQRILLPVIAALAVTGGIASAQSYPGDPGTGTERGMESVNNSGQVGTVTVFGPPGTARLVVVLHGTPEGRVQSVRIYRGPSCDDLAMKPAYFVDDMRHGVSSTALVKVSATTLLSGNYDVVVFSSTAAGAHATACGHLYHE